MDRLREFVLDRLAEIVSPAAIYEKSNLPSRARKDLPSGEGWQRGGPLKTVRSSRTACASPWIFPSPKKPDSIWTSGK